MKNGTLHDRAKLDEFMNSNIITPQREEDEQREFFWGKPAFGVDIR